jgi:hypothetical protein
MDVPSFLFELLEKELTNIQEKLLEKVAKKYDLSETELKEEFLTPLKVIPNTNTKVVICKKQKGRKIPLDECRCMARIWNRGKGGQCTRKRKGENEYCCQHIEKRKHGDIREMPSKKVFCHKTKILYK